MKVRVKYSAPNSSGGFQYRGQIIEVEEYAHLSGFPPMWKIVGGIGLNLIFKEFCEPIEETMEFQPKSGMVFEHIDGTRGFFLAGFEGQLFMQYVDKKDTLDDWDRFEGLEHNKISKIWLVLKDRNPALSVNRLGISNKLLWSTNVVQLNDEYTATIEGDTVKVGCQTFPLEKVREIVRLADNK